MQRAQFGGRPLPQFGMHTRGRGWCWDHTGSARCWVPKVRDQAAEDTRAVMGHGLAAAGCGRMQKAPGPLPLPPRRAVDRGTGVLMTIGHLFGGVRQLPGHVAEAHLPRTLLALGGRGTTKRLQCARSTEVKQPKVHMNFLKGLQSFFVVLFYNSMVATRLARPCCA